MKRFVLLITMMTLLTGAILQSKEPVRVAVLPFQNMDGLIDLNVWSYKLQDSVFKILKAEDPDQEHYHLVPSDSIEILLAEMNIDPTNPQYPSDMWKATDMLNVKYVLTGNFDIHAEKFLVNAYIYDARMRLPHPKYQAKNIFKSQDAIMESAPMIVKRLLPGLKKN